jgi:hypothetical protein
LILILILIFADIATATKDQTLIDYFDPIKREAHEKLFALEKRVKELETALSLTEEAKRAEIIKYSNLFKDYKALVHTSFFLILPSVFISKFNIIISKHSNNCFNC